MSNNTEFNEFLDILKKDNERSLSVDVNSKKSVKIQPLSFKQQKELVTSGMNGPKGIIQFLKTLNSIIIENTGDDTLKIYDRVPIILELKGNITSDPIEVGEAKVFIEDLKKQYKPFEGKTTDTIEGDGFQIVLDVPTLKQENRHLSTCLDRLRGVSDENVASIVSTIVSFEIPKFIKEIKFGESVIAFDSLGLTEQTSVVDKLPANITNKINEFILKVREYDESILTVDENTIIIDHSFFE